MSVQDFDTAAGTAAMPASIAAFLGEIAALARTVEPPVAQLLDWGEPDAPARPWNRGRREGLEVCLNMLRYIREEVARGDVELRLDSAIEHLERELALVDARAGRLVN